MDFELHHHQQQQTPQQHASTSEATSHFHHHHQQQHHHHQQQQQQQQHHHHPQQQQQQQQQSGHALTLSLPIHAALNAIHSPGAAAAAAATNAPAAATAATATTAARSVKLSPAAQPLGAESERLGGHGRDDCWSEGATFTLIDAWGERYLELNRGNLKQKHWQDVAVAVNRRDGGSKPAKTDVQCKNRLDTLKKKYKLEKSRVSAEGSSRWPFLSKLEDLIGSTKKGKNPHPPPALTKMKMEDKKLTEDGSDVKPYLDSQNKASSSSKDRASAETSDSCLHGTANAEDGKSRKKRKWKDSPFKDLARAIIKFGEVYDKIESAKQQQLLELEKQRMEFTKDLELQRMQLFMQTQVELAKMKYSKHGSTEHYL